MVVYSETYNQSWDFLRYIIFITMTAMFQNAIEKLIFNIKG